MDVADVDSDGGLILNRDKPFFALNGFKILLIKLGKSTVT